MFLRVAVSEGWVQFIRQQIVQTRRCKVSDDHGRYFFAGDNN